jgi:hypothetical protein
MGSIGITLGIVFWTGCSLFLTRESDEASYRKVKVGMTYEQVSELVGDQWEGIAPGGITWPFLYGTSRRLWPGKKMLVVEFTTKGSEPVQMDKAVRVRIEDAEPREFLERVRYECQFQAERFSDWILFRLDFFRSS